MNHIFYIIFLFFILLSIKHVFSENVIVNDINDLLLAINKNNTIIINKSIVIYEDINISSDISYVNIRGNNINESFIKFENINKSLKFNNQYYIEISNINIIGNLKFENVKNVNLNDVIITGTIKTSSMGNNLFSMKNSFMSLSNRENIDNYLIQLDEGYNSIENSKFYGNSVKAMKSILFFNGKTKYSLNISGSYFFGEYKISSIYASDGYINIESSEFSDCYDSNHG